MNPNGVNVAERTWVGFNGLLKLGLGCVVWGWVVVWGLDTQIRLPCHKNTFLNFEFNSSGLYLQAMSLYEINFKDHLQVAFHEASIVKKKEVALFFDFFPKYKKNKKKTVSLLNECKIFSTMNSLNIFVICE